jgi:protein involved in sex pheromone biosynthesis
MRAVQIVGILLIAALLVSGCGDQRTPIEKQLSSVDYKMATLEVGVAPSRELLEKLTRQYIELTRKYAKALGRAQVKSKLEAKELELQAYCLSCSALVTEELAKL